MYRFYAIPCTIFLLFMSLNSNHHFSGELHFVFYPSQIPLLLCLFALLSIFCFDFSLGRALGFSVAVDAKIMMHLGFCVFINSRHPLIQSCLSLFNFGGE